MKKSKSVRIKLERYNEEHVPPELLKSMKELRRQGHDALLVGGCIRDYLLGFTPKDFDCVTDAKPEQVAKILPRARVIGRRFLLVQVRRGKEMYEVATYRRQAKSSIRRSLLKSQGIPTENVYGNQYQDAFRRDFTINALYYDPSKKEIVDHVGGLKDIENRVLRSIGAAEVRFREDPVRILRAARLSAKLNLKIDDEITEAIKSTKPLLEQINRPRLRDELLKLFITGHGENSYRRLRKLDLLRFIFPQHPQATKMISLSMVEADERIASGEKASPAYLFGTMLWHIYTDELNSKVAQTRTKKKKTARMREIACYTAIQRARDYVSINKGATEFILGMFFLQPMLEAKQASAEILEHPQIRAAVHLLSLRAKVGEVDQELVNWWQKKQPKKKQKTQGRMPQRTKTQYRRRSYKRRGYSRRTAKQEILD